MGTQSQAGYNALQNTQGLKYGDFNVTQDWMFASNPLRGQGGANYVVFNPNDKTQKFAINDLGNLSEYLTLGGRKAEVQRPDYLKYGLSDTEDPTGRYENVFNTQTLEQIAEQKRQQDLVAQVQAGKITPDQATQQANQPSGFSNPANDVYNKAYNNPDTSQKPLNPNAIQSVEVQMPDGSIRRLDKNSDKYQEALKQGGNIISGTGTNADTSQMQGNQISQEQSQQIQQPVTIGPTLQQGARGSSVTQLQNALGITADGIFGPKTLQAVKNFQISKGLTPDGIVGPKTWSALSSGSNISPVGNFSSGASSNNQPSGGGSDIPISTGNSTIDTLLGQLKDHAPQNNFASVYKEIYSDLGIDSIKEEYEKSSNEYSDLQDKKNDEKLEINNNPWFSEGRRVKELEKLDKKYEGKELILQNRIKLLESNISTARDDAQFIAGKTLEQAGQIDNFNQDIIMKAIDIAEKELESTSKLLNGDPSSYKSVQGGLYNIKTGEWVISPKSTSATNTDLNTGESQYVKEKLLSNRGSDGYVDPYYYSEIRSSSRLSASEFDRKFGYLVNPVSKQKFGVGTGVTGTNTSIEEASLQQILDQYGVSSIDQLFELEDLPLDVYYKLNSLL